MRVISLTVVLILLGIIIKENAGSHYHHALAAGKGSTEILSWANPPRILHSEMATEIGYPAIVRPGQEYPSIVVHPTRDGSLEATIIRKDDNSVDQSLSRNVSEGAETTISFNGNPEPGRYRIELRLQYDTGGSLLDAFYFSVFDPDQVPGGYSRIVHPGDDGRLVYIPDYRGNRIPDYSSVGYKGGGVPIPDVPVKAIVEPQPGDNTALIQQAINEVSNLPLDQNGFRGAVLLKQGFYEIAGSLRINRSGVVLRGEGQGDVQDFWLDPADGYTLEELRQSLEGREATVLVATGSDTRRILDIAGAEGPEIAEESVLEIVDQYVPVGSKSFTVTSSDRVELLSPGDGRTISGIPEFEWKLVDPNFKVGDKIIVERSGNADWISEIKMDQIPPRPDGNPITQWSPFDLRFENEIVDIQGDRIFLKHPVVNAIETRWGGGRIYHYSEEGRINQVGIENLRAISYWKPNQDGVDDTRHPDRFVILNNLRDAWVRNVTVEHFYGTGGAISTGRGSIALTIMDSSTLIADRSFYAGPGYDSSGRTFFETGVYTGRYGFDLSGQGALVMRNYAINNRHAYVVGSRVTGPNVFLDGLGEQSLTWSEPHHRWSVAGLYDNVQDMIALMNRLRYGSGHGWAGANFVAWNTEGRLVCEQPATAQNYAIGHVGTWSDGPFHTWNLQNFGKSYGYWESHGAHVKPRSLYLQQLKDRLGPDALENIGYGNE